MGFRAVALASHWAGAMLSLDPDETLIVRKWRLADPAPRRRLPRQFAQERPIAWPIVVLTAMIAFAIVGAILAHPWHRHGSGRRANDAHVLMQVLER